VRDIVNSIAKIPDRIKKEIYIQECAQIMNISEAVLFNTLAQIDKKDITDTQKQEKSQPQAFNVVRNEEIEEKVDVQFELERKIIELLLVYGDKKEKFEDLVLKENEEGVLVMEPESVESTVFKKIFLDLQEDEIEFTNSQFRDIYYLLIAALNQAEEFAIQGFMTGLEQEMANNISSLLMEDEKYALHDWERKDIYPKAKETSIAQLVSETILTLRCFLIKKRMLTLQNETQDKQEDNKEVLEEIMNYLQLNTLLNKKLNRVLS
jgi:DNA primase